MLRILALACFLTFIVAHDRQQDDIWNAYKLKFQKAYGASDEIARRTIFENTVAKIHRHNLEADLGLYSYWQGLTRFTDMTLEEYRVRTSCYRGPFKSSDRSPPEDPIQEVTGLPTSVDWRKKGYVTPVKDQGQCGSCWAFSTTGTVEGQHFAKTKKLVSLSEQNLVDCSGAEGDQGCNGGWPFWAQTYILKNKGIDTEESYPYTAEDQDCKFKKSDIGATIKGYHNVTHFSEKALETATANVGPISVCIDASQPSFQSYRSGVYDEPDCSTQDLDHCVLVVGYGVDSGKDYYIVKNSWGTDWGMKGYIWMSRNKKNQCGIATDATYPLM